MRRPTTVLRFASASAMLLVGCESGQPLEPFKPGEDIAAAMMSGGSEPAAPSNALATVISATQIDVSWQDNSSTEKSFQIYRSPTGEAGTFRWLANSRANTTSFSNEGLAPGVRYCYAVLATGRNGRSTVSSAFSNTACATTLVMAPTNVTAVASSTNRIDIQWQDNSTNETRFEVYRSVYPQGDWFSLLATTAGNTTGYSDQGLLPGTEYCYKIQAVQVSGGLIVAVWPSNIVCAWTLPNATTSATATPDNSHTVSVRWTAVGAYFRIDRSTDGGVVWNTAGTAYNTRWFWDNVEPEQAVCYRVVTYNTSGEAPPSDMDCTTSPARPTEVMWSTIDASTVELTWRDNSSVEDGYEVRAMYDDCWSDWDGTVYCDGYFESVIAVLPANTTSFRSNAGGGGKVSVYAMKDGGYSTAGVSP